MKKLILYVSVLILVSSCGNQLSEEKNTESQLSPDSVVEENFSQQDSINAVGEQILLAFRDQNVAELKKYFSENGVRFSPYAHIDSVDDVRLNSEEFADALNSNRILVWGNFDGSGEPIKLGISDYLKRFVYNADYLNAEAVGYNEVIKKGNTINNLDLVYPGYTFIDYHFSGFDPKFKGMDWTSLRLVFKKENGDYFLVGVVHDQWTI